MTGQKWVFDHYVNMTQTMGYDGDGEKLQETVNSQTTYYLKSSVLGGAIIEELNGSGQKTVGYVYAGRQLVARQSVAGSNSYITWKRSSPAGTGEHDYNVGYVFGSGVPQRIELDPLGARVPLEYFPPPEVQNEGDVGQVGGIMDSRWSNFFDLSGGCSKEGVMASCSGSMMQTNLEAEMRASFGDRWYDLPGNSNEREWAEGVYVGMVQRTIAAYNAAQKPKTKPKLKKGKVRKLSAKEKQRNRDPKRGNSEDDPQKTLTIEHFTAAQESWIRYEMRFILTPKCDRAYEAEKLNSPSSIISDRGVVIRHAKDLAERSAADLGLDAETYRDAHTKVNSGQGGTVFGIDGTLQIYLNSYAFVGPSWDGKYFSLAEILKHEFIHEGIREWRSPWHPFSHDLRGFPGYDRIMEGCK